jgi:hypothetical protein
LLVDLFVGRRGREEKGGRRRGFQEVEGKRARARDRACAAAVEWVSLKEEVKGKRVKGKEKERGTEDLGSSRI